MLLWVILIFLEAVTTSLEGTQKRIGVTDKQLDQQINQLQFTEIAKHIGTTASFEIAFDLDTNEKQQITTTKVVNGHLDGTIEMLTFWKKKVGRRATYRALLKVVNEVLRDGELGEKILNICQGDLIYS